MSNKRNPARLTLADFFNTSVTDGSITARQTLGLISLNDLLTGKEPVITMPTETEAPRPRIKTPEEIFAEKFPATARLFEVKPHADAIERFFEWLKNERRLSLMTRVTHTKHIENPEPLEALVATYFGLDLDAVEREAPGVEEWYAERAAEQQAADEKAAAEFEAMARAGRGAVSSFDAGDGVLVERAATPPASSTSTATASSATASTDPAPAPTP